MSSMHLESMRLNHGDVQDLRTEQETSGEGMSHELIPIVDTKSAYNKSLSIAMHDSSPHSLFGDIDSVAHCDLSFPLNFDHAGLRSDLISYQACMEGDGHYETRRSMLGSDTESMTEPRASTHRAQRSSRHPKVFY